VDLRSAAVLVLLTPGPAGPCLLFSRRSPDLTDYPGRPVFPGGASEPQDGGPVGTALREAAEEVGLDPDSVKVLGCLPPLAVPETGFLVTPVVAWSPEPEFNRALNAAEVTAVAAIPLHDPPPPGLGPMTAAVLALVRGILSRAGSREDRLETSRRLI
jgi:8-oxo-dGTP pyrophosphatase MutT (NUDIX family)